MCERCDEVCGVCIYIHDFLMFIMLFYQACMCICDDTQLNTTTNLTVITTMYDTYIHMVHLGSIISLRDLEKCMLLDQYSYLFVMIDKVTAYQCFMLACENNIALSKNMLEK